jgi:hypothetical protein
MLPTNPKTNPVFQRLTRHPNTPFTVREAAWLAGGLGFLVLIFSLVGVIPANLSLEGIPFAISLIATWLVYPMASLFGAVTAAAITGRDVSTDLYQLMRQTPVASTDIVWAYVFTTLYRLRAMLALMIALLPALVFGSMLIRIGGILFWLQGLSLQLAVIIEQWGVFSFAVIVGVLEGLLRKKVFPSVIFAPLVVILFRFATLVVCSGMARPPAALGVPFSYISFRLGRAMLPYLLSLVLFRLASHWA